MSLRTRNALVPNEEISSNIKFSKRFSSDPYISTQTNCTIIPDSQAGDRQLVFMFSQLQYVRSSYVEISNFLRSQFRPLDCPIRNPMNLASQRCRPLHQSKSLGYKSETAREQPAFFDKFKSSRTFIYNEELLRLFDCLPAWLSTSQVSQPDPWHE